MGQEVHREGLIHGTELLGSSVIVDVEVDDFGMAMLEKYLQVNHPLALLDRRPLGFYDYQRNCTKMKITFNNESEALAFHLRYHK